MQKYATIALAALLSTSVVSAANANACAKDPYKALLPLSKYAVAENFCSSKYPLPKVTTTSTVTVTAGANHKRGNPTTTTTKAPTTTPAKLTTTSCTGACSTWTSASQQGGGFLSTLCSCIETAQTTTTTVTKTLTLTTTTTSTSAAPTFTCSSTRETGPQRCNCYYDTFCQSRYVGPVNASATVSSYQACVTFAGNVKTGRAEPADLNYFPATGLCEALIFPPGTATDPSAIAGAGVINFENCYRQNIQDLNRNGCGCDYAEDCDMGYNGVEYAKFGDGVADCQEACDYAGSNCVGFTIYGGSSCTLYSSITDKYNSFGITGYTRASCSKPCVSS